MPQPLFAVVESLDHLWNMDLREKWQDPDFTEETRNHLWQYVAAHKTHAGLYTAVPKNVMGKTEFVAGSTGEQLARGELDLRNMDLFNIGQNLLADLRSSQGSRVNCWRYTSRCSRWLAPGRRPRRRHRHRPPHGAALPTDWRAGRNQRHVDAKSSSSSPRRCRQVAACTCQT